MARRRHPLRPRPKIARYRLRKPLISLTARIVLAPAMPRFPGKVCPLPSEASELARRHEVLDHHQHPFAPMDRFIHAGNACRLPREPISWGESPKAQPHLTGIMWSTS